MNREEYIKKVSNYSILFVDDDEFLISTLERIYKKYFQTVYTAHNGLEGFNIYKTNRPDIIVSDITMPVCNGFEMADMLKGHYSDVRLIFATGHNEPEYLEKAGSYGWQIITKPITLNALMAKIIDIIENDNV